MSGGIVAGPYDPILDAPDINKKYPGAYAAQPLASPPPCRFENDQHK